MKVQSFVSIDLETTGLNAKEDRIIEIGAVKYRDGLEVGRFHTYVNPGRNLETAVSDLTGIRQWDLEDAPYIEEVLQDIVDFLEDLPLLGHSILFDYSFLKRAAVNQKIPFVKKGIDTLKIARKHLTGLEHKNLSVLCEHFGIPICAHRALEDAQATAKLYEIFLNRFYTDEDSLFHPQELRYSVKKDTPATKAQKERLGRILEQHGLVLDRDMDKMTKSEASRLTDQILSGKIPGSLQSID